MRHYRIVYKSFCDEHDIRYSLEDEGEFNKVLYKKTSDLIAKTYPEDNIKITDITNFHDNVYRVEYTYDRYNCEGIFNILFVKLYSYDDLEYAEFLIDN